MLFGILSVEESTKKVEQYHEALVALWLVSPALSYIHCDENHKGDMTVISPPLLSCSLRFLALEAIWFHLHFVMGVPNLTDFVTPVSRLGVHKNL